MMSFVGQNDLNLSLKVDYVIYSLLLKYIRCCVLYPNCQMLDTLRWDVWLATKSWAIFKMSHKIQNMACMRLQRQVTLKTNL